LRAVQRAGGRAGQDADRLAVAGDAATDEVVVRRVPEQLRLADAVLPGRGVDGHQRLVRSVGHLLGDHAPDLGELLHQVVLRVQAAGGVDDHHVGAALASAGDGVEGHGTGVRPLGALDEIDVGALGPALELLDGGGAERVGRADHDLLAERVAQVPGELADRRRLAGAVDADDEDDRRLVADVDRVVARAGQLGEQLGQPAGERLAADERALLGFALEPLDHLGGGACADVGVDQRLLEPLPGRLVEVALEQRRLDLGGERLARLAHRVAQAAEETASAIRRAGVGRVFDGVAAVGEEELVPVPRHDGGQDTRSG
jgi:hypothetical protein